MRGARRAPSRPTATPPPLRCPPPPVLVTALRSATDRDNRTAIVFKTSTDGGSSWSRLTDICPDGRGAHGCLDYEAVYDEIAGALIVQYCQGAGEAHCTNMQLLSTDRGASWSKPMPLKSALGRDDGVLVGPGRALQARLKRLAIVSPWL
eukprot:COSAG01_NODE_1731_length_9369_cov_35.048220_2_plen_150_part_00